MKYEASKHYKHNYMLSTDTFECVSFSYGLLSQCDYKSFIQYVYYWRSVTSGEPHE